MKFAENTSGKASAVAEFKGGLIIDEQRAGTGLENFDKAIVEVEFDPVGKDNPNERDRLIADVEKLKKLKIVPRVEACCDLFFIWR